jgi:hypothetical protein
MRRSNIFIRLFFLVSVIFLMLNLVLLFSAGCKQADASTHEKLDIILIPALERTLEIGYLLF